MSHFLFLWTINYFSFSHVIGFLVIPPWFTYVISPLYPPLPRPCSPVWRSSNHCCFSCWNIFFLKWRTTMQLLHKIQDYSKWLSGSYTIHSRCNPMWFLFWAFVKDQVYVLPLPASIPELKVQIRTAIETITADMWNELDYCVDVCWITKGVHVETCKVCNKNLECCSIK